jgi:hypothetical protein
VLRESVDIPLYIPLSLRESILIDKSFLLFFKNLLLALPLNGEDDPISILEAYGETIAGRNLGKTIPSGLKSLDSVKDETDEMFDFCCYLKLIGEAGVNNCFIAAYENVLIFARYKFLLRPLLL